VPGIRSVGADSLKQFGHCQVGGTSGSAGGMQAENTFVCTRGGNSRNALKSDGLVFTSGFIFSTSMRAAIDSTELSLDYLIARSGFIGRLILNLYRFMREGEEACLPADCGVKSLWLRRQRLRRFLAVSGISRLVDILYTYWIGGSLTRSDQLTFARLHGLEGRAHILTLGNALGCGIPCGLGYLVLGHGFDFLAGLNSYAELVSLLAKHTSVGIGLVSLLVDAFRAIDALWHRRCWAPFGFLPLLINLPTYLKRFAQAVSAGPVSRARQDTDCRA